MSKKKKGLSKELLNLKMNKGGDTNVGSEALDLSLDLNLEDLDEKSKTSVATEKDQTIRLIHNTEKSVESPQNQENSVRSQQDEVKVSYGLPTKQQVPKSHGLDSSGSQLKHSEHLRIAQNKINELESEVGKLRRENEDLASAGETFKKLNDEYFATIDGLKAKVGDQRQMFSQEVELLKKINANKDKQINEYKQQIEEYKSRIDNNFQRVRKREKDLEHRLEIAKMEEAAVIKSKDQLILDLKRRIDELGHESDNFRKKSQENYKELQSKQQLIRSVIRALRIALTKLEGDDASDFGLEPDQVESGDDPS